MRRYIVLLLISGIVWAQTDFDKLVLKNGTTYYGEYSKTEGKIVFFKPQEAFGFQPIPVKRIRRLELKEGQIFFNGGGILIAKKNSIHHKRRIKEKAIYDAKSNNLKHWALYGPISTIIFGGCVLLYKNLMGGKIVRLFDSNHILLAGFSAASLSIPYFVLNNKEKFTYPKSLTDDDDRLYYKQAYSNKLKQRKFKYIVGSTIVTGAVVVGIFFANFGSLDFGPGDCGAGCGGNIDVDYP